MEQQPPLDLARFFNLSEEEMRSLGIDGTILEGNDASRPTPAIADSSADTRSGDPGLLYGDQPDDPPGTTLPPVLLLADASNGRYDLPDRADDLPWPTEEEMLAAGLATDPGADAPPGVRQWVSVPLVPISGDGLHSVQEGISPVADISTAPLTVLESMAGEFPDALPAMEIASATGHGPYGLTEEQLAELGPEMLRELDLAMARPPDTLPLHALSDDGSAAMSRRESGRSSIAGGPAIVRTAPPPHLAEQDGALEFAAPTLPGNESTAGAGAEQVEPGAPLPLEGEALPAAAELHAFAAVDGPAPPEPAPAAANSAADQAPAPRAPISKMALELLEVFMEEAIEMLDSLHTSLETLEQGRRSTDAVIEARRTVHTIKGGARMCGLKMLTDTAHACEDLIGQPTSGTSSLPAEHIALLFRAEQEMRAALATPHSGPGSDESMHALVTSLRDARRTPEAHRDPAPSAEAAAPVPDAPIPEPLTPPSPQAARAGGRAPLLRRPTITSVSPQGNRLAVDLSKVEGMVSKVTEIVANRATAHGLVEHLSTTVIESMRTVHRLQTIATQLQYQIVAHGMDVTEEHDPDGLALETYGPVRQLLLQLQEAVADQQALVQATMDIVANKRALAAIETRLDTDLQGALLNMRLLPLSQLRVRLDQVVRSAAATAGREVRWTMEGQNVALDKHVCDRLFEPLMHLLRNAIDHGIESPDDREAHGKPRVGRVVVHASVEGNQATVSVSDDGAGMDPDRIAAVALARGVITPEQATTLTDREKLELVFRPGFSTATSVTELSGRGMGMEIVRETCTRMGGSVTIAQRPGGGTIVTLLVPLSMSVVHALIVRDGGCLLGIPASQVLSVHLVRAAAVMARDGQVSVRIGREDVPLYRLPATAPRPRNPVDASGEFSVLVVPYRSRRVALAVDEMVNEEDLIVKPLPLLLQGVERLLGAVVLADGTPTPVLNLQPLLDRVIMQVDVPVAPAPIPHSAQTVLVVDDSLTMRTALRQTLEHAGYTVMAAHDGHEALELVRAHGLPHLVTLDIEMPRMDGLETLYALRHLPGGETIPIFMLTSRSGNQHKRTAMQLGATQYFTKPYHDREFLRAVQEATGAPLRSTG